MPFSVADRSPGVYIQELESPVHSIVGVPTAVAAFVGRAEWGPATSVRVTSWSEYERQFGTFNAAFPMSIAAYLFFLNGGSVAEVVRLTTEDDTPAKLAVDSIELEAASAGSWGNALTATVDSKNAVVDGTFDLTLSNGVTSETYPGVTASAGERSVETALQGSRLVKPPTGDVKTNPKDGTYSVPPEGEKDPKGTRGADAKPAAAAKDLTVGDDAKKTGIYALDAVDIFNMLCLPTASDQTYPSEQLDLAVVLCEKRRAVLIVDPPSSWGTEHPLSAQTAGDLTKWPIGAKSPNAAVYYPNLLLGRGRSAIEVRPCGAIAGIWAATDASRGVWKAPAGTAAALRGVTGLSEYLDDDKGGPLNARGVNVLRSLPAGTVVWGARTAKGADADTNQWKYLPVKRTALFMEETLQRGTQWVVFEPNDEPLWSAIRMNVGAFMNGLFRQGAFQGSTPAEAYLVKCDKDNNPQDQIDLGMVNILVGFAPLKPAEFVVISIQQQTRQQ